MELETINKLYLELSQVATATTQRELVARQWIAKALNELETRQPDSDVVLREYLETAKYMLRDRN